MKDGGIGGQTPGHEHLRGGIAGSQEIFKRIRRVVPAAGAIKEGSIRHGAAGGASVQGVARLIQERIVAATLLAHEFQQFIRQRRVHLRGDGERGRLGLALAQKVTARFVEGGEIQFGEAAEFSPGGIGDGLAGARPNHGAAGGVANGEGPGRGIRAKSDGDFAVKRKVSSLVDANVSLGGQRKRGAQPEQQEEHPPATFHGGDGRPKGRGRRVKSRRLHRGTAVLLWGDGCVSKGHGAVRCRERARSEPGERRRRPASA